MKRSEKFQSTLTFFNSKEQKLGFYVKHFHKPGHKVLYHLYLIPLLKGCSETFPDTKYPHIPVTPVSETEAHLLNTCLHLPSQMKPLGPCLTILTQKVPGVWLSSLLHSTGVFLSSWKGQYTPHLSSNLSWENLSLDQIPVGFCWSSVEAH